MPYRSCAAPILLLLALALAVSARAAVFIDSAGRRVVLPDRIERILPAGPASAVFVYVLVPNKLIGWPEPLSRAQRALLPARFARLPTIGQLGGAYPTITAADVIRLHPDLIIGYGKITPPTVALADRIQQQTRTPYILIDDSIQVIPQMVRALSPVLGAGDHGLAVGTYAFRAISLLRGQLLVVPADARPRVYYGRGPDGLETPLPGSASASDIEQMGVINVAEGLGRGAVAPVTREQIMGWNPQIVIAQQRSFYNALLRTRQWRVLDAASSKKVYLQPAAPFGWIDDPPGLNRLLGLYWLSSLFYPDVYQQDLHTVAREFYQLFYGIQLTDRQLDELVRPAQNPVAASRELANVPIFGAEPPPMPGATPNPGLVVPPAGPSGRAGLRGGNPPSGQLPAPPGPP
jgi:iron complex transport system substrate-binding protein